MTIKDNVLVVDDEELNFGLIQHALKGEFETHYVPSGKACLEFLRENRVDTILLDINMPEMNGYDVCRQIKETSSFSDIPVIFVSALDSIEERVTGYDAGGDDYIVKPFQAKELLKKAQIAVQSRQKFDQLKQRSDSATEAAMQALTSTGELGVVINYFTQSFRTKSYEEVAITLCESLSSYGLKSTIQIRPPQEELVNYNCSGKIKPLEASLLAKLKDADRIYDFDMRTVINFEHISVLIKNMPIDDSSKYGRFKDNLALLVEGANARVESLSVNRKMTLQKQSMENFLSRAQSVLNKIHKNGEHHKLQSTRIFENLIVRVEEELLTADLTEYQEEKLLGMVTETSDKMNILYDESKNTESELKSITDELKEHLETSAHDKKNQ